MFSYIHSAGGGGGSFVSGSSAAVTTGFGTDQGSVVITLLSASSNSTPTTYDATITTCGAVGADGPTASMCASTYAGTDAERSFRAVDSGIQWHDITRDGLYMIRAFGARGGAAYQNQASYKGGDGALASAAFALKRGQQLHIAVGQSGNKFGPSGQYGGGGGGGTFVYLAGAVDPLVVAGGGGGENAFITLFSFYLSFSNFWFFSHLHFSFVYFVCVFACSCFFFA